MTLTPLVRGLRAFLALLAAPALACAPDAGEPVGGAPAGDMDDTPGAAGRASAGGRGGAAGGAGPAGTGGGAGPGGSGGGAAEMGASDAGARAMAAADARADAIAASADAGRAEAPAPMPPPPVKPGANPAPAVISMLQGQSNAVLMNEGPSWQLYGPLVRDLTGIPKHSVLASTSCDSACTLASGTPTYNAGESLWLRPEGNDPATWPPGKIGEALRRYIEEKVKPVAPAGTPVVFLRFHSEYDTTAAGAEYRAANRRFVGLVRSWLGKPVAEAPIFYGSPAFWINVRSSSLDAVRTAWYHDVNDAAFNAHWMFGSMADSKDLGDGSHADDRSLRQAAGRTALAVARWLYDRGYATTDLSWLPRLGPRVTAIRRVPGRADQIDLVITHDKGTHVVVPPAWDRDNLSVAGVRDNGTSRAMTRLERVDPTTVRVTLDRALTGTDAQITFDWNLWNGFHGVGRMITDNWHTLPKPAWAQAVLDKHADGSPTRPRLVLPLRKTQQRITMGQPAAESLDDR